MSGKSPKAMKRRKNGETYAYGDRRWSSFVRRMRQERGATGSARRASAPPISVSVLVFATIGAYGGVRR
jgi:hypothetical protein